MIAVDIVLHDANRMGARKILAQVDIWRLPAIGEPRRNVNQYGWRLKDEDGDVVDSGHVKHPFDEGAVVLTQTVFAAMDLGIFK